MPILCNAGHGIDAVHYTGRQSSVPPLVIAAAPSLYSRTMTFGAIVRTPLPIATLMLGLRCNPLAWGRDHALWRFDLQPRPRAHNHRGRSLRDFSRARMPARHNREAHATPTRDRDPTCAGSALAR